MTKRNFSISVHIMTLLAYYSDGWHTSSQIAESINMNPALVRKELASLNRSGLIESKEGKNGGVRLSRRPADITLADIFLSVKGDDNVLSFSKNSPDQTCQIGHQINKRLENIFDDVDQSITNELQKQTLEAFKNQF